jgi:hypothetical protein
MVRREPPDIQEHIRNIVEGSTHGNPEKILSWTTDSLRDIGRKLSERYGEHITHVTAGSILEAMGCSKQANSHLKGSLIPRSIYVKGYKKVSFVLLTAVLCLAALKYPQLFI